MTFCWGARGTLPRHLVITQVSIYNDKTSSWFTLFLWNCRVFSFSQNSLLLLRCMRHSIYVIVFHICVSVGVALLVTESVCCGRLYVVILTPKRGIAFINSLTFCHPQFLMTSPPYPSNLINAWGFYDAALYIIVPRPWVDVVKVPIKGHRSSLTPLSGIMVSLISFSKLFVFVVLRAVCKGASFLFIALHTELFPLPILIYGTIHNFCLVWGTPFKYQLTLFLPLQ